jgi:hypothetical protein
MCCLLVGNMHTNSCEQVQAKVNTPSLQPLLCHAPQNARLLLLLLPVLALLLLRLNAISTAVAVAAAAAVERTGCCW